MVELDGAGPIRIEAVPLRLDFCHTRLAGDEDRRWIERRFVQACASLGTEVRVEDGRLVIAYR